MDFRDIRPFARFVRYMGIQEDAQFPPYFPRDARLFYVTEGIGAIEIDGQVIPLPTGSVLYVNVGQVYRLCASKATYLAVNFDFTDRHTALDTPVPPINVRLSKPADPIEQVTFENAPCFDNWCVFHDCHALQIKLAQLANEYARKLPFSGQETSHLLASVLIAIARRAEQRTVGDSRFDIEAVMRYVHAHIDETLDNRTVAEQFHFHPNYISAEFKRYTGQSLHRYVLETRVMMAVSLMESGYRRIDELAARTGFCDANYFSRYFKQVMGISPAKYIRTCVEKA